jgi:hypothetical protein
MEATERSLAAWVVPGASDRIPRPYLPIKGLLRGEKLRGAALGCRPGPKPRSATRSSPRRPGVITSSSFAGEGHRKVRAHLRRRHRLCVGKNRVLRLIRSAGGALSPRCAGQIETPSAHIKYRVDPTCP